MENETRKNVKIIDELSIKERLKLDRETIKKMIISSIAFLSILVVLYFLL